MEALLGDNSENVATDTSATDMRSFRLGCVCRVYSISTCLRSLQILVLMALWIGRDKGGSRV